MRQPRNIIFDLGNVLITFDPLDFLTHLLNDGEKARLCHSLIIQSPEWRELDRGQISVEQAKSIFIERQPALREAVELFFQHWLSMFQPIEETVTLLDELRAAGYRLYVLSNIIRESYEDLRARLTFWDRFEGVVVSYALKTAKPEPAIYHYLLDHYHLNPNECLFIDDMEPNVAGALAVGIPAVRFHSVEDLRRILRERGILGSAV
ncbi:MAG TPA: HAD family phosphatase [bacterium]|mgnify:CR=1 FL=1|nr:HAD family phosphatase [bacterium]HOL93535.1 HAD family phosphatase [bacterium]HPP00507.1 HAD family phosphatase [bacterium]HXK93376.1 HAD family phosphatase [bacterium]